MVGFLYWFDKNNRGVIFSLAPASSLTLIDYQTFQQDTQIPADIFIDPTALIPACAAANVEALNQRPKFKLPHLLSH
jgi:hypothetical protein